MGRALFVRPIGRSVASITLRATTPTRLAAFMTKLQTTTAKLAMTSIDLVIDSTKLATLIAAVVTTTPGSPWHRALDQMTFGSFARCHATDRTRSSRDPWHYALEAVFSSMP